MASASIGAGESDSSRRSVGIFTATVVLVIVASCLIAGSMPLAFSVGIVFLFAGPHNWMEARYFLTKMPAKWGKLWVYFSLSLGGILLLTIGQIGMGILFRRQQASIDVWGLGIAVWNTLFIGWIIALVLLRSQQNPRRPQWVFALPIGLVLVSLTWLFPIGWSLALVYLHPLVALLFFDRELGRRKPEWRNSYRVCLLIVPICLVVIFWQHADSPNLAGDDRLTMEIANHAGGSILSGVSTHMLVSTHTFLEMLHYAAWIVAIPLIGIGVAPWKLVGIPLAKSSRGWQKFVVAVLLIGGMITLSLWAGFLIDYPVTRDFYFTIALAHVLAEVPFLLRLL